MSEALERSIHGLEEALEEAATARAKVEALDERRKQILAAMVVKHRGDGKGIGEAEHFARADETYKLAAAEWEVANYDYRRTDARAEGKRLRFDAWRTQQSTERAKMGLR
jgi:hypothetical protein